jgi:hypothetical protein
MEAETRTIVRAGLDASGYQAGAAAIAGANEKISDSSDKAAGATQRQREEVRQTGGSIEALQRQLDATFRSQERFARAQETVNSALERGRISQTRATELLQLAEQRYTGATAAAGRLSAANDNAAQRSGRFGAAMGQVGFQVQDFATQVSMGQNALVAFSTQFGQLAGFFGTGGAIAGAAVLVATLAYQLIGGADAAKKHNEQIEQANDLYRAAIDRGRAYRDGLDEEATRIRNLRDSYVGLNDERRQYELAKIEEQRRTLLAARAPIERDASRVVRDPSTGVFQAAQRTLLEEQFNAARQRRPVVDNPQARELASVGFELEALRTSGELTGDALVGLQARLREASLAGGALGEAARDTAQAMTPVIERLTESDTAVNRLNQAAALASGQGLPALQRGLGGAAAEGARLADELERIARINVNDPLAGIARSTGQVTAQLAALRRGGLAGLRAERDTQAVDQAGQRAYEATLEEQRRELARLPLSNDQVRDRSEEAARAARLAGQEGERERIRLRDAEAAAQDAQRDAQRSARAGARAGASADRREQRDVRREEEEARRLFDTSRSAAEEYARTLERLADMRPTLERLFGADGANEVIDRQATRAIETMERANGVIDKARDLEQQTSRTNDVAQELGLTFSSAFEDAVVKGESLQDVLKGIEQDLLRLGTRKLVTEPLMNLASGFFQGGLAGPGSTGGSFSWDKIAGFVGNLAFGAAGGGGGMKAPIAHSGGMVGNDNFPTRSVPSAAFAGARRFHGGGDVLAPDEVPIIAQVGERVLNRQEAAAYRGGGATYVFNFPNADAQSFRKSEAQVGRQAHRMMQRAQRST